MADENKGLTRDHIDQAYKNVLLRSADEAGICSYLGKALTMSELESILRRSPEYSQRFKGSGNLLEWAKNKRILLFGAYGNGNLGDAIQARSILNSLNAVAPGMEIWATSEIGRAYDFPAGRTLPVGSITSVEKLSKFDALIIGGGGVLSHPHDPLGNSDWAKAVPIPMALLGVGANVNFAPQAEALIVKAAWVSGRDAESIQELSFYRRDVYFAPDPVLVDPALGRGAGAESVAYDTCWILRGPIDKSLTFAASVVKPQDVVIGVEPREDAPLKALFPDMIMTESLDQVCSILRKSRRVVSMRFHGVILGLRMGRPCFAVRLPKGKSLFSMLGLEKYAFDSMQEVMFAGTYDTAAFETQRRFMEGVARANIRAMLHELLFMPRAAKSSPVQGEQETAQLPGELVDAGE
jgi:hypothetical protein